MRLRALLCLVAFALLSGCAGSRGGIVDRALTDSFYEADTKAERLLRYFEVQALLVRFVSESGGSIAGRNAIAMANVAATEQLDRLVGCLRTGSVNNTPYSIGDEAPVFFGVAANQPVRVDAAYCSFFESRLLEYEESLLALVRQAARDDPDAKLLEDLLAGPNVLNFANVLSTLFELAGRVVRDEFALRAFTADALELEVFVWQPGIAGPDQIYAGCATTSGAPCDDTVVRVPERASIDALRSTLAAANAGAARPTILVWHFEEVEAFMIEACRSLNGDAPVVAKVADTQCSAKLPFPLPPHPPIATPVVFHPAPPPGPGPGPVLSGPTAAQLKQLKTACDGIAQTNIDLAGFKKLGEDNAGDVSALVKSATTRLQGYKATVDKLSKDSGGALKCAP
jgi:hypothetical protein